MNELLKKMKALLAKGFATKEEKAALADMIAKLKDADQQAVADEAAKVAEMPEEKPEGATEEEVEKGIKALFEREGKAIRDEIKSWMESQADAMQKKAGVYNPNLTEKRKRLSDSVREISKALLSGDAARMKELTTDATGSPYGGYTVDTELSAEIRHLITEYGVARREMTALPLTKHSYKANDLATDVTVYWVDEAAAIGSTQVVLGHEELTLKKLGAIATLTAELLEDGEIDLFGFIASRVAEGFAKAEDDAFFKGDGTSTFGSFTGLLEASDVTAVTIAGTTFASVDADDLLDLQDAVPTGFQANGKYFMHRTIRSVIRKLKASGSGEYVYQTPSENGPATIWGRPVVHVESMPALSDTADDTAFVLYGDLKKACILGYKSSGISVARFNAGTVRNVANNADVNLITTDREAVRWTERVGYIRILPGAVKKLKTAAASS